LANKDAHIKLYKSSVNIRINYFSQRAIDVWMERSPALCYVCAICRFVQKPSRQASKYNITEHGTKSVSLGPRHVHDYQHIPLICTTILQSTVNAIVSVCSCHTWLILVLHWA